MLLATFISSDMLCTNYFHNGSKYIQTKKYFMECLNMQEAVNEADRAGVFVLSKRLVGYR